MGPNETALSLDDTIRAEGQPMGRFNRHVQPDGGWYWYSTPDGTHDGFIWRLGFYTLPHQEDQP